MKEIAKEELRSLQLGILDYVMKVCDDLNITCFLCGGSLLGAYRHKGFIPWDDDIDVMMLREDYEKFLKEFPNHEYFCAVDNRFEQKYPFAYASVNDTRTIRIEDKLRSEFSTNLCVNIDVFPIDKVPNTRSEQEAYFNQIAKTGSLLQCATYKYGRGKSVMSTIRKNIGIFIYRCRERMGMTSADKVVRDFMKLAMKYQTEDTKYFGVTAIAHNGIKEVNPIESLIKIPVEFEGRLCNSFVGYDNYLSQLYGEYMKMPPLYMQVTHHTSKYFWK